MPSILFVCTANQFRSPIAAASFSKRIEREAASKRWRVESAGTWAENGRVAPAITLQVAGSLGLSSLERHLSRQVSGELLEGFDLVLVMEVGHKEALCLEFPSFCPRVYLLSQVVDGIPYDIPDPFSSRVTAEEAGMMLSDLLARGKERILKLAESLNTA
jgi:protein-tyrosine phosphatase